MATLNPFDLLGDDDTEDPTLLIAKMAPAIAAAKVSAPAAGKKGSAQPPKEASVKLPSKPLPPAQAVREARSDAPRGGRGGFRGGMRGRGGGRGFNRESDENENSYGNSNGNTGGYRGFQEAEAGKTVERYGSGPRDGFRGGRRGGFNNGDTVESDGFRGGRRGGFNNGEAAEGERPRRTYERRSGTGRENNFKREGAGRGNWGTPTDDITPETKEPVAEIEKVVDSEKPVGQESEVAEKDVNPKESEEKEPEEDKEMTLEEYEKVLEEKRKALLASKPEERKVNVDKEFESMQLLENKKTDEDVAVKPGSEKEKRKDAMEKAKKSLSINEFLKPAEGDNYYRPGGRGRGRGQGRGGGGNYYNNAKAPSIADVAQFPSLGGK